LATDPVVPDERIEAAGARPASLEELLGACRAVTLHVPLSAGTDGLIGAAELGMLPQGAVLVNTARARLVDMDAIAAALESGRLAAAAFDVLPKEPPDELPSAPNLVITPHSAWFSPEAESAAYRRPVEAIREVLAGREAGDRVRVA
jgi:D-3-phosphoglycerate dehydrogenase